MFQKNQILLLNLLLVALAAGLAWKLKQQWEVGGARAGLVTAAGSAKTAPNLPAEASVVVAVAGTEIITRNPFSQDRNSLIVQASTAPPGPPPVLPIVIGTMRLGSGYEALLAEKPENAGSTFRQVKVGETVGGYKVAEIRDDEVIVELNGERTHINVYLSASGVARTSGRTLAPAEPVASAAAAPRVESSAPTASSAAQVVSAGSSTGTGVQLPSPDPWLKITLEGNRKRYERTTMFGPQIWYEDVK